MLQMVLSVVFSSANTFLFYENNEKNKIENKGLRNNTGSLAYEVNRRPKKLRCDNGYPEERKQDTTIAIRYREANHWFFFVHLS